MHRPAAHLMQVVTKKNHLGENGTSALYNVECRTRQTNTPKRQATNCS